MAGQSVCATVSQLKWRRLRSLWVLAPWKVPASLSSSKPRPLQTFAARSRRTRAPLGAPSRRHRREYRAQRIRGLWSQRWSPSLESELLELAGHHSMKFHPRPKCPKNLAFLRWWWCFESPLRFFLGLCLFLSPFLLFYLCLCLSLSLSRSVSLCLYERVLCARDSGREVAAAVP